MNTFPPRRPRVRRFFTPPEKHRINDRIVAREVRLIDETGKQVGVVDTRDALRRAEDAGLDLVEVAGTSSPPVCRILDYGKFKYKEQKKEAEARKHRTEATVKELRIRYRTDIGDLETKLKHAREFLAEGDKVKFSMRFRGREAAYIDLGREKFETIIQRLSDVAQVEEKSPLRGNFIYVVFMPLKGQGQAQAKPAQTQPPKS